jgi:hypothetical protein
VLELRWIRTSWTDERLDDLNGGVDELSRRMDAGFARVDAELRAVNGRIDSVQQTMLRGFIATWVAMFTGFIGLAGLILAHG